MQAINKVNEANTKKNQQGGVRKYFNIGGDKKTKKRQTRDKELRRKMAIRSYYAKKARMNKK